MLILTFKKKLFAEFKFNKLFINNVYNFRKVKYTQSQEFKTNYHTCIS